MAVCSDRVERDLQLLGLLVLENRLKPESADVLAELQEADLRTVMVTGDHLLTSLSIARECGMLDASKKTLVLEAEGPSVGRLGDEVRLSLRNCITYKLLQPATPLRPTSTGHSNEERVMSSVREQFERNESQHGLVVRVPLTDPVDDCEEHYQIVTNGVTWDIIRQHRPDLLPLVYHFFFAHKILSK